MQRLTAEGNRLTRALDTRLSGRFVRAVTGYHEFMVDPGQQFHPGQVVSVSGIYRCDVQGHGDHRFESTDVLGHRFPPLPDGWSGWVLEKATARH